MSQLDMKKIKDFDIFGVKVEEIEGNRVYPENDFIKFEKEAIDQSLVTRFEEQVKKYKDKIAICSNHQVITYDFLNRRANQLAGAILEKYDDKYHLSDKEKTRYTRQLSLDGWGIESQEKLKATSVFVAGAGGSGTPVIMQLALLGVGTIIVCDHDEIELSNLNRQFLYDESMIGMNKALAIKEILQRKNPNVNVVAYPSGVTADNIYDMVGDSAVIFDNIDDVEAKFFLSECAYIKKIPHIISSMIDIDAYAAVLHAPHTPCFHCLYDRNVVKDIKHLEANENYKKMTNSVAAPALFVGTGFAVNEAVKIILGFDNPAYNKYFLFNQKASKNIVNTAGYRRLTYPFSSHFKKICREQGFRWEEAWRGQFVEELTIRADPHCPLCGENRKEDFISIKITNDVPGNAAREKDPALLPSAVNLPLAEEQSSEPGNRKQTAVLLFNHGMKIVIGVLGVLKSGKIYVPLDGSYPQERLRYMMENSETRIIITDNCNYDRAVQLRDKINRRIPVINIDNNDEMSRFPAGNPHVAIKPHQLAYIMYTSGSTGMPKGVMQTHRNVLHYIKEYTNHLHIHADDRLTLLSSYGFDASVMDIYGALLNGATLYPFDMKQEETFYGLATKLAKERISIYHSVPTVYRYFLDTFNGEVVLPWLRLIVMGGEAVYRRDVEKYRKYFHPECLFVNLLGATEASIAMFYFINRHMELTREAVPLGFPVEETEVLLLAENNEKARLHEIGEILFKSDYLALGYLKKQEKTADVFVTDPISGQGLVYRTGDLGRQLADGSIEYIGRKDFQVKVNGYRIELGEIESAFDKIDGIKKSVVTCRKDQQGENYLVGYFVKNKEIKLNDVIASLKTQLPEYMVPGIYMNLDHLPLTVTGKIDRKALPDPGLESKEKYVAPRNKAEEDLAAIWAQILEVEKGKIGIDDNFFELGGQSFKAIILAANIYKVFHIKVSLVEVFDNPTIRQFASLLKDLHEAKDPYDSIQPVEKREYYPLSSAQKRLHFLHQLDIGTTYNMTRIFNLEEKIDVEKIKTVIKQLIARHECLRTSFHTAAGEPVQKIAAVKDMDFEIEYFVMDETHQTHEAQKKDLNHPSSKSKELRVKDWIHNFHHPFYLELAPLMRVGIIELHTDNYMIVTDIHHIISDGISGFLLEKDFFALYRGKKLSPLPLQYKDFSQWQHSERETQRLKQQEAYWLKEFQGNIPVLDLPIDYPRPLIQDFTGSTFHFPLGKELSASLQALVSEKGVTTFIVLLAAFDILLAKLSGQEDIVVGTVLAGRSNLQLEPIIGLFVNTLPLRSFPAGRKSFIGFLEEVKTMTLAAFDNQEYQLEDLLHQLDIQRDASRNPLTDVGFSFQRKETPHDAFTTVHPEKNSELSPYQYQDTTTKADLTLFAVETIEGLLFAFQYCTTLFKPETIQRFSDYYLKIIAAITARRDIKISEISILSPGEKQQLLYEFNNAKVRYPGEETIHRLFEKQVEKAPDSAALMFEEARLTYKELNKKANRLARILIKKGVGPNTIVAVMLERSMEMIAALLGILKAGGAYLPIEPDIPLQRVIYILEDSRAAILLTDTDAVKNHTFTAMQTLRLKTDEIHVTPRRPQITDFDSIPIPDRSLVDYEKYNRFIGLSNMKNCISIQGTRGCPYKCAYCHKIFPKKHVVRSAEHIFSEVKLLYDMGVRRFALVDDIFNLNIKNSTKFFQLILKNRLDLHLSFNNGMRGDILTKEYIDLMVKAGVKEIALALETASPRLQKLIKKNLNLEIVRENMEYFCEKYPQLTILLFTMIGFPSETKEEAQKTLNFIKSLKWLHFPYVHVLKIYPNTDMEQLAVENGIPQEAIKRSLSLSYHELPDTLPFEKSFVLQYQADFFNNYFLLPERLLKVLPYQLQFYTEDELAKNYNLYMPININNIDELLEFFGITREELGIKEYLDPDYMTLPGLNKKLADHFKRKKPAPNALRVLLLDLTNWFSSRQEDRMAEYNEAPLGLISLLTYLYHHQGSQVHGKIGKSKMDFDNYEELKAFINEFNPDVIGIRSMSMYRESFHESIAMIRQWGIDVPIISGGPYATSSFRTILQDRNVDIVVIGEGEITFNQLIEKIRENDKKLPDEEVLKNIKGIAYNPANLGANRRFCRKTVMMDAVANLVSLKPGENLKPVNQPGDLAYIIYTSGTTGKPKGVMIEHRNVLGLMLNANRLFTFSSSDVWTMYHSYSFDFSVWEMYGALLYGGRLLMIPKIVGMDPEEFSNIIERQMVTVLNQTPTAFFNVTAMPAIQRKKTEIKYVIFGGEALNPLKLKEWNQTYPQVKLINMFGITETTVHVTFKELGADEISLNLSNVGKPLPSLTTYIMDKNLRLTPLGVTGEICVGGQGVGRGYLNRPQLTADRFVENLYKPDERVYRSGDLGRWLPDGNIEYLGRIDHQVKIRGYRIELPEIESWLLKHEAIKEAVVIERQLEDRDKCLCAYFVAKCSIQGAEHEKTRQAVPPGDVSISSTLREYLSQNLPGYMIPAYFIPLDQIPLTPNGKIDRAKLLAPHVQASVKYLPPENEIEEKLIQVWSEVLGVEENTIGRNTNFFDIGGDSIKVIQVTTRLRKYMLDLDIKEFYSNPVTSQMARLVKKIDLEISPEPVEGEVVLTPIQRFLFFDSSFQTDHHFNLSVMLYRKEGFEVEKVKQVFTGIVTHHDALRIVFREKENEIIQVNRGIEEKLFDLRVIHLEEEKEDGGHREMSREANKIQASMNIKEGPLVKLGLFKTKQGDYLLIAVHHLVIDGVSLRILLEDFHEGFRQVMKGETITFPLKTHSFQYWSKRLQEYASGEEILKELKYWSNQDPAEIKPLPVKRYARKELKKIKNVNMLRVSLGREQTHLLLTDTNKSYNTDIKDILLATLGIAIHKWAGLEKIAMNMEGHGREKIMDNVNIERTIGFFTTQFPVILEIHGNSDLPAVINQAKDTMRRIPHNGIGYGILKYLTPEEKKDGYRFRMKPEINFNYLGEFGQENNGKDRIFSYTNKGEGESVSLEMELMYPLTVFGIIIAGRLAINLLYNKHEFDLKQMEQLRDCLEEALTGIIDHCTTRIKN